MSRKNTKTKKTSGAVAAKTKSKNVQNKNKRLTKGQLEERLHYSRVAELSLFFLASFALLINIGLAVTGGWDDLIMGLFALSPIFALFAVLLSWRNWKRFRRRRRQFVLSLCAFLLFSCAFFFCNSFLLVKQYQKYFARDYFPEIVGTYKCASSEQNRELEIFDARLLLATKHYQIEDYRETGLVNGSYEARLDDGKYYISAIIKENTQKDKNLGFDETNLVFENEDDRRVRLSSADSGVTRFCVRE